MSTGEVPAPKSYVREKYLAMAKASTDAPWEYHEAVFDTILSALALDRRWYANGTPANIYTLLCGPSSRDRKSTSIRIGMGLLKEVRHDLIGPEELTPEGLFTYVRGKKGKPGRNKLLLTMPEFGQTLATQASYNAGLGSILCRIYDGDDYTRVRSGKKPSTIIRPRVSLIAASAYGMLQKYATRADWASGFFARMVFVRGLTRGKMFEMEPGTPENLRREVKAALIALDKHLASTTGEMRMSEGAAKMYKDAYNSIFAEVANGDPDIAAQRERLVNSIQRIALLRQIDIDPNTMTVGEDAMFAALEFGQKAWNAVSFVRGYAMSDDDLRKVWVLISQKKEGMAHSELLRASHITADSFNKIIATLKAREDIKEDTRGPRNAKFYVPLRTPEQV